MIDIRAMNPPEDCHRVRGSTIYNGAILNGIEKVSDPTKGMAYGDEVPNLLKIQHEVEKLAYGEFYFIGTMLGEELRVDCNGRFRVGSEDKVREQWRKESATQAGILRGKKRREAIEKRQKELEEEALRCKHDGWVIHDIQGHNRFLCKECDERFPVHPKAPAIQADVKVPFLDSLGAMTEFRNGMKTFSDAVAKTKMSVDEFKQALIDNFPPLVERETIQHVTLSNPTSKEIVISEKPLRTTCPDEIEKGIFPTYGCSNLELSRIWMETFPDVTNVDIYDDELRRLKVVTLTFVDNTKQRVEFDEKEIVRNVIKGLL